MRLLLTALTVLGFSALLTAQTTIQIDPPYNPDTNEDGAIGSSDLMGLLALFGYDFEAESIFVDGMTLEAYLMSLTLWI